MRLVCDLSGVTTADGSGCCLEDKSDLASGGYCVVYNEGDATGYTYYMTESEFEDALDTTFTISSNYLITEGSDNDSGFETFYCTVASLVMTCDHF